MPCYRGSAESTSYEIKFRVFSVVEIWVRQKFPLAKASIQFRLISSASLCPSLPPSPSPPSFPSSFQSGPVNSSKSKSRAFKPEIDVQFEYVVSAKSGAQHRIQEHNSHPNSGRIRNLMMVVSDSARRIITISCVHNGEDN